MGPGIAPILQRFPGAWAALRQADAMRAGWGEIGAPGGRDRVLTPGTTVQLGL